MMGLDLSGPGSGERHTPIYCVTLSSPQEEKFLSDFSGVACPHRGPSLEEVVDPLTRQNNMHRLGCMGRACPTTTPGRARA